MINEYLGRIAARAPAARAEGSIQNAPIAFKGGLNGMQYLDGATTKQTVNVPEGTIGLTIVTTTGFTSLTLTGHTSGAPYGSVGAAPAGNFYTFPFSTSPDDQADFAITTLAGQVGTLYARADFSPPERGQNQNFTTKGTPVVFPDLAFPIAIAGGGIDAYGAWAQIAPAGSLPSDPAGLSHLYISGSTPRNQVQLGVGPPGSEVVIGTWITAGVTAVNLVVPIFPLILLVGNPRVAARAADSAGAGGTNVNLSIGAYALPL